MRRGAPGLAGAIALVLALMPAGVALASPRLAQLPARHFTRTYTGTSIASHGDRSEEVYKVIDSLQGHGAAVGESTQKTTLLVTRNAVDSVEEVNEIDTTYFANGVSITKTKFYVFTPNAAHVSRVTGSGHCAGGTAIYRTESCKYKVAGGVNQVTGIATIRYSGTITG